MSQAEHRENPGTRTNGDLIRSIGSGIVALVRQEFTMAKAEMASGTAVGGAAAGAIVTGGAVALVGLIFLCLAAAAALALVLPAWAAALVVGVALMIVCGLLIMIAVTLIKRHNPMPQRTVARVKEDVEWTKGLLGRRRVSTPQDGA